MDTKNCLARNSKTKKLSCLSIYNICEVSKCILSFIGTKNMSLSLVLTERLWVNILKGLWGYRYIEFSDFRSVFDSCFGNRTTNEKNC